MEGADPGTKSTQLKWPHGMERTGPWKKAKASKLDGEPITLTKGDLYNNGNTIPEVTKEALHEVMTE